MRLTDLRVLAAAVAVAVCASAMLVAQDKRVTASNGWVKLPAAGETQAMAFATVENPTMYEVNVVSATAGAAARVELRDASKAVTFIAVPAYGRVDMSADGAHLVLVDLKSPLKEGDTVSLTLSTDVDATLTVSAKVRRE